MALLDIKVLHGRVDNRKKEFKVPHQVESRQFDTCTKFLQLGYHHDGEFLPDKFVFEGALADRSLMIASPEVSCQLPVAENKLSDDELSDDDEKDERDSRELTALAIRAVVMSQPFHHSAVGPGMAPGPRRWIGVMKPAAMYNMMCLWCRQNQHLIPSWTTFRRALRASSPWLSFRKSAGQHGLCDECLHFKRELRRGLPPILRTQCLEDYAAHLLRNWRDRQADAAWHAQSSQTRQLMLCGTPLGSQQHSVLLLRSDGLDQAKHKVPRTLIHSKSFEEIIRPAMHCQMIWAHHFGFEFALSDPDVKKDSCTHMDVIARCLSNIYDAHGQLPKVLYVVLDNTARDNKNQHMLRFWIKLRLMKVFEMIYVCYPVKGHTHGPLDAIGGHAVVRCSNEVFNTPQELVQVYQKFLDTADFEEGTTFKTTYKHDNSANWMEFIDDIELTITAMTGPKAPHGFRILTRKQLTVEEARLSDHARCQMPSHVRQQMPVAQPDDLMLAVHQYMSDAKPYQVELLLTAAEVERVRNTMSTQPRGTHPRRRISSEDRNKVATKAMTAFQRGAISEDARDFLVGWARETLRREPRPPEYSFLRHRFDASSVGVSRNPNPHQHGAPRPINILRPDGEQPIQVSWRGISLSCCPC